MDRRKEEPKMEASASSSFLPHVQIGSAYIRGLLYFCADLNRLDITIPFVPIVSHWLERRQNGVADSAILIALDRALAPSHTLLRGLHCVGHHHGSHVPHALLYDLWRHSSVHANLKTRTIIDR